MHGEQIRPLRSLTMSASDAPDDAAPSDATLLFVDRASAARPGFAVDSSNSRAIAEICRRLDGIPPDQLVAARVVSMNPDEIVTLLDERFRLLTGGRRARSSVTRPSGPRSNGRTRSSPRWSSGSSPA